MALQPVRRTGRNVSFFDPDREFEDIYDRMGQLLSFAFGAPGEGREYRAPWVPMADVSETEDSYVVELELPGVRKEDIDIQLVNQLLIVSGEVKEEEKEGKRWRRKTRRAGRFEFRAQLPGDVNPDMVDARMQDGVLTITVHKAEAAKPRRVEISA